MTEAKDVIKRFNEVKRDRNQYEGLWQEIANITSKIPRHFAPIQRLPGEDWTYKTFDTTAEECLSRWVAIFAGLLTNQTDRWIKFDVFGQDAAYSTRQFFEWIEEMFLASFHNQGFYSAANSVYEGLGLIGNGMPIIDERPYAGAPGFQGFRIADVPFEQCYFLQDGNMEVKSNYRYVKWTADEIISYFGESGNIPEKVTMYRGDLKRFFNCIHEVRPKYPDRTLTTYYSVWVLEAEQHVIRDEELEGNPYISARLPRANSETYGRSPAYKCLAAIQSLNYQAFQRDQAFGFIANPVHAYQKSNKIQVSQVGPGAWLGMQNVSPDGLRVLERNINPEVFRVMMQPHIDAVRRAFYTDQIEQMMQRPEYGKAETVKDLSGRNRLLLGPVLTSISQTFLIPAISRCLQLFFKVIQAHGIEIPDQIRKNGVNVELVGPLAIAQRAARMEGYRDSIVDMSAIIKLFPDSAVVLNGEESIRFIAETNYMPTRMLNSPETVAAMKAQEAKIKSAQNQLAMLAQGATGVKDMAAAQKMAAETANLQ